MRTQKSATALLIALFFSVNAMAATFQGVKAPDASQTRTIEESVIRFKEMDKEFLIAFGGMNSAFYSFPKTKENASQVRNFLNDRMKSKKKVSARLNALTIQIVSIGDK